MVLLIILILVQKLKQFDLIEREDFELSNVRQQDFKKHGGNNKII